MSLTLEMIKYNYVLKRSSARKTLSVSIQSDNSIVVHCPQKTKIERVEAFLAEKSSWIEAHMRKNNQRNNEFYEVISGKTVLVKGKEVALIIGSKNGFYESGVCVTSQNYLKKVYIENLGGEFLNLLNSLSEQTNLEFSKMIFKSYKSRWGCCNTKRELAFNYKLLMLPKEVWAYVIVHELCHTRYMNHSKAFWKLVGMYLPNYKNIKEELKRYSFVCGMYR